MSSWRAYKKPKSYPPLVKDISAEVAVIGGGMAGVLCAYQLCRAGFKVVLVEKKELGSYATVNTTAFITEVIDSSLSQISSIFDKYTASLVWQSGHKAIDEFEKIIKEEKIECEFTRCPNFVFASSRKQWSKLEEDYKFYKRYKFKAHLRKDGNALGFDNFGFMEIPDQAKFHPTKFLYALAERAKSRGAKIFEKTAATKISGNGPVIIETSGGKITAGSVIIATYKPLIKKKTRLKKAIYRSYVFQIELPKNIFKEALYEDLSNPYYYFRIDSTPPAGGDYDQMIIGGEDHRDIFGETLARQSFESLKAFADKLLPDRRFWIINKWSGPILEPSDGLPLIGEIKPFYYVATAFSGNGMTYSMISSLLLRDLVLGKRNLWTNVYDPKRALFHPRHLAIKNLLD